MSLAQSLLLRFRIKTFLENVVTGDESCVLYFNRTRKAQWLSHGRTASEALNVRPPPEASTAVTANIYAVQLQTLSKAMQLKRPGAGVINS
ncbi:unnamed protein product [Heligmosomoides polygyrus]|uniref:Uncharacterized protein n=1 Tax=Heligmosomoides polygyrus TaxID=6339 RepID=A0A183FEQ2_HELPZ|nr:unnamed protein product [Heligmosomoides polygyrus]